MKTAILLVIFLGGFFTLIAFKELDIAKDINNFKDKCMAVGGYYFQDKARSGSTNYCFKENPFININNLDE